jgi:hypothetical protein
VELLSSMARSLRTGTITYCGQLSATKKGNQSETGSHAIG